MPDFLPRREANLIAVAANFRDLLLAAPQEYGISPQDAADFAALYALAAQAYRTGTEPSTSTTPSRVAKRDALDVLKRELRRLAALVRANPAVTDAQRVSLGLKQRRGRPGTVSKPASAPRLVLAEMDAQTLRVHLRDRDAEGLARPAGVIGATIFRYVGDHPPHSVRGWTWHGNTSATRLAVTAPAGSEPGQRLWVMASWLNTTCENGPFSEPVGLRLNWPRVGKLAA